MNEQSLVLESAKFLKQLQDEAWSSVRGMITAPENNTLHFEGFYMANPHIHASAAMDDGMWVIQMVLNGVKFEIKGEYKRQLNADAIARNIIEGIQTAVTGRLKQFLTPLLTEVLKPNRNAS